MDLAAELGDLETLIDLELRAHCYFSLEFCVSHPQVKRLRAPDSHLIPDGPPDCSNAL
jgi:hypothetical protein